MEKGKQLSEDDKKLEISVNDKMNCAKNNKDQSVPLCEVAEDTEDFLFNVAL